ncbi:hypothetical protein [Commensalibacter oyaizuii]|uniref:Secreted protein n=1 Tax=Commensalibacter oyaizuii TaxID=3043873 RepID=A0ABT6Q1Z1_9PROT|nr:hypothetical protein [Commensalibacter sp. TBRC 16381]MDI2091103.1 hypothetical protein [Commensalibacter sp. TBRC 16381]
MIIYSNRIYIISILSLISIILSSTAYANYKRCWINNGIPSINCAPADGSYYTKQKDDTYKKCPVVSGRLRKPCKDEDGFAMIINNHLWYQCPIQHGKKLDHCSLATGYYTISLPHLPRL